MHPYLKAKLRDQHAYYRNNMNADASGPKRNGAPDAFFSRNTLLTRPVAGIQEEAGKVLVHSSVAGAATRAWALDRVAAIIDRHARTGKYEAPLPEDLKRDHVLIKATILALESRGYVMKPSDGGDLLVSWAHVVKESKTQHESEHTECEICDA